MTYNDSIRQGLKSILERSDIAYQYEWADAPTDSTDSCVNTPNTLCGRTSSCQSQRPGMDRWLNALTVTVSTSLPADFDGADTACFYQPLVSTTREERMRDSQEMKPWSIRSLSIKVTRPLRSYTGSALYFAALGKHICQVSILMSRRDRCRITHRVVASSCPPSRIYPAFTTLIISDPISRRQMMDLGCRVPWYSSVGFVCQNCDGCQQQSSIPPEKRQPAGLELLQFE